MSQSNYKYRVGELRPSQILFSFGVGAVLDLPNLSVMVMGLEDWNTQHGVVELGEQRLLAAIRRELGQQVKKGSNAILLDDSKKVRSLKIIFKYKVILFSNKILIYTKINLDEISQKEC